MLYKDFNASFLFSLMQLKNVDCNFCFMHCITDIFFRKKKWPCFCSLFGGGALVFLSASVNFLEMLVGNFKLAISLFFLLCSLFPNHWPICVPKINLRVQLILSPGVYQISIMQIFQIQSQLFQMLIFFGSLSCHSFPSCWKL